MIVYQLYWVVVDIVVPVYILCKKDKITKERKSDQKKRKEKRLQIAGTAAAWVQRVHLHPSISSNGCIAPVLMKNFPISDYISV